MPHSDYILEKTDSTPSIIQINVSDSAMMEKYKVLGVWRAGELDRISDWELVREEFPKRVTSELRFEGWVNDTSLKTNK